MSEQAVIDQKAQDNPKRWAIELEIANKTEKNWRSEAEYIGKKYRGEQSKADDYRGVGSFYNSNSFNILWSNTELLKPAVFKRTPKPLIRPNFPERGNKTQSVTSAASDVLQRALTQALKAYSFTEEMDFAVLDALLAGRGLMRVRYEPYFETKERENEITVLDEDGNEQLEVEVEQFEALTYEEVRCEFVHWEDFRRGAGRKWSEVNWVGFRHCMTREELIEQFGEEIGAKVPLTENEKVPKYDRKDKEEHLLDFAEVWEIWDKKARNVKFVCLNYLDGFLSIEEDPLNLENFFPVPKPLQFIQSTDDLTPLPEYGQYATLAEELETVTSRIINLVGGMRVRGVYDATLSEIGRLFDAGENEMIAVENSVKFIEAGGFDRALWMVPLGETAGALSNLISYRNGLIQNIYEITGISDIMRGSSSDIETARAQEIKSAFGTLRLQDRQQEVQRFARDLIRIKAEIIAEQFDIQTLQLMTGLDYPTNTDKQQAGALLQFYQQTAAQMGGQMQDPRAMQQMQQAQELLQKPSWEQIKELLTNDVLRNFKVDIETDSTLHAEMVEDKRDINELLQAIVSFMQGVAPMVQSGALPMEAAKALLLAGVRRYKLGTEVEEALEKIGTGEDGEAEENQPSPEVQQAQIEAQRDQQQQQFEIQKLQLEQQIMQQKHENTMREIEAKTQSEERIQAAQMQDKLLTGSN